MIEGALVTTPGPMPVADVEEKVGSRASVSEPKIPVGFTMEGKFVFSTIELAVGLEVGSILDRLKGEGSLGVSDGLSVG